MRRPPCMTFAEYDAYVAAAAEVKDGRPPLTTPCADCTVQFALSMRAVGVCDGEPQLGRPGRPATANPTAQQLAWRERSARHHAKVLAERGKAPVGDRVKVAIIPGEEELGVQSQCAKCGEWWPYHTDFFYPATHPGHLRSTCRACEREIETQRQRVRRAARRAA